MGERGTQRIDLLTIIGLGMMLMPLMTMWHEIGGHAAACLAVGGRPSAIGAFYVDCPGLDAIPDVIVASAGVVVNIAAALVIFPLWRRAQSDWWRLVLWLIWLSQGFVAAGYLLFSGFSGVGDFGVEPGGGLVPLAMHAPWPLYVRVVEIVVGGLAYMRLVRLGIATLSTMLGTGPATRPARRRIAHGFYVTCGLGAVAVGLFNPVGMFILIMSAAASSFGGLAGFISIGFAARGQDAPRAFVIDRRPLVILLGAVVLVGFALLLGPTIRP
jgi:hypothetical protein